MMLDVSRVHGILFDLDGTLSNTDDVYIDRVVRWLRPLSFLFPRRDAKKYIRQWVMASEGFAGWLLTVPDRLGVDDELSGVVDWFARLRGWGKPGDFQMIEGIRPMLEELSKIYPLAVVSSRDRRGTEFFLEQFSLRGYFKTIVTALSAPRIKPHPAPVRLAAETLGLRADECLMVGDTRVDIIAGMKAGAQTVGVLCGFGRRADLKLAGASAIIETTADLTSLLG